MKPKAGSSLSTRGLVIVSIPIASQILLLVLLLSVHLHSEQFALATSRSTETGTALSAALNDFLELDCNGQRFGLDYLTSAEFREKFIHLGEQFQTLRESFQHDPEASNVIENILSDFRRIEAYLSTAPEIMGLDIDQKELWVDRLGDLATHQLRDMDALQKLIHQQEHKTLAMRESLDDANKQYETILYIGAAVEFLLIWISFVTFRRDISRRLETIKDNSLRMASGRPLRPRIGGGDELSTLDDAFHRMAIDLTQVTKLETALIQNARDVVCSLNDKLAFVEINDAAEEVFGYKSDELNGMRLLNISLPEDANQILQGFEQAKQKSMCIFEARIVRKDSIVADILWTVSWATSEFVCVAHDNRSRKTAERARSGLISMVRNELEQPLSTVATVLDEVSHNRYGGLSEKGEELSKVASAGMTQMLTLVNDLLDMEQMELGQLEIRPASYDLSEIIQQAIYSLGGLSITRKVNLRAEPFSLRVMADKNRVIQVLVNLFSNAIKFSPPNTEVVIDTAVAGKFAEVQVRDSGRGIPAEVVPFIFERFRQSEASDASKKGGSGLGLAICKALVEMHGGTIRVQSLEGRGTVFTFQLPLDSEYGEASR